MLSAIVSGCSTRAEEMFILKNNSDKRSEILDCYVSILSPPGGSLREYNEKKVIFFFRNEKYHPIFKREITFSAATVRPKIDWSEFPRVKISLLRDDQQLELLYIVDVKDESSDR
jgi:hypothetical protein